jgi:hypothetical protein
MDFLVHCGHLWPTMLLWYALGRSLQVLHHHCRWPYYELYGKKENKMLLDVPSNFQTGFALDRFLQSV